MIPMETNFLGSPEYTEGSMNHWVILSVYSALPVKVFWSQYGCTDYNDYFVRDMKTAVCLADTWKRDRLNSLRLIILWKGVAYYRLPAKGGWCDALRRKT